MDHLIDSSQIDPSTYILPHQDRLVSSFDGSGVYDPAILFNRTMVDMAEACDRLKEQIRTKALENGAADQSQTISRWGKLLKDMTAVLQDQKKHEQVTFNVYHPASYVLVDYVIEKVHQALAKSNAEEGLIHLFQQSFADLMGQHWQADVQHLIDDGQKDGTSGDKGPS